MRKLIASLYSKTTIGASLLPAGIGSMIAYTIHSQGMTQEGIIVGATMYAGGFLIEQHQQLTKAAASGLAPPDFYTPGRMQLVTGTILTVAGATAAAIAMQDGLQGMAAFALAAAHTGSVWIGIAWKCMPGIKSRDKAKTATPDERV